MASWFWYAANDKPIANMMQRRFDSLCVALDGTE